MSAYFLIPKIKYIVIYCTIPCLLGSATLKYVIRVFCSPKIILSHHNVLPDFGTVVKLIFSKPSSNKI